MYHIFFSLQHDNKPPQNYREKDNFKEMIREGEKQSRL